MKIKQQIINKQELDELIAKKVIRMTNEKKRNKMSKL